ncbi:MAG TPA: ammonia channel protein, partial [Steroidobacteraceae bacterium]
MRPGRALRRAAPAWTAALCLWGLCVPLVAHGATTGARAVLDSGDTAWLLTATTLVLFMTLPGLAVFYAGLVRSKNVLSVLMQCF